MILLKQFYAVLTIIIVMPFLFGGAAAPVAPLLLDLQKGLNSSCEHNLCSHRVLFFNRDKSNGFDSFLALEQSEDMLVDEIIKVIRIVIILVIILKPVLLIYFFQNFI